MIKLAIIFGLVVLMRVVSGALEQQAVAADEPFARGQKRKAIIEAYEAHGNHESASRIYAKAAKHYHLMAEIHAKQDDQLGAADHFTKAAAMHAVSGKHARMQLMGVLADLTMVSEDKQTSFVGLPADYAEMDNYMEQGLMHYRAARRYRQLAGEHAAACDLDQAHAMNQAAAEQYETSAKCSIACGEHKLAAEKYSRAARRYKACGNLGKAWCMKEAVAEQYEAHAMDLQGQGNRAGAAFFFSEAFGSYKVVGNSDKARAMMEAAAVNYETSAGEPEIPGGKGRVADRHYCAADSYEAIGRSDKALSLWQRAASLYEAMAMEHQGQNNKERARHYYSETASVYDRIGDGKKAQSMRDAMARLEDVSEPPDDDSDDGSGDDSDTQE